MKSFLTVRDAMTVSVDSFDERGERDKYITAIQRYSGNPRITTDDVHVRAMWLCNSQRDHYYSRFTPGALDEIAELLPGRPVMRGHRYDQLPIGRFFAAKRMQRADMMRMPRQDNQWVRGLFYVPKDAEGDSIVRRIDDGIYREVSIGWRCLDATCSLCEKPINDRNKCPHVPGEVYDEGLCDYRFSGITSVLEGSLVFAGGQKDTGMFDPATEVPAAAAAMTVEDFIGRWDMPSPWMRGLKNIFVAEIPELRDLTRQRRGDVQMIECSAQRFESREAAAQWVRDHEFRADRFAPSTEGDWLFRQFDLENRGTDTVKLDEGVTAKLISKTQRQAGGEEGEPESIAALFAQ